jgi:hypothetical protein
VRFGGREWWCNGTFGAPTFLEWIDGQHAGFIHGLSRASLQVVGNNPWPGSPTVFMQINGKSFDELWAGYAAHYNFRAGGPIESCPDPRE